MKRIRMWLGELTLSQQLFTITVLVLSMFLLFLFLFLTPQVDSFSENSMYEILHNSQQSMAYLLNQQASSQQNPEMVSSSGVIQEIYNPDQESFTVIGGNGFTEEIKADVLDNLNSGAADKQQDFYLISGKQSITGTSKILYCITELDDGRYLITVMMDSFREEFRNSLVNVVININIVVVGLLFVVLMVWVASLIHPLNQIKNYIQKIKNDDEPPHLNIHRRDEIGEVAEALQDMEDELQHQTQVKEEMIQNISHDLKTPIATIKSYAESIKDGIYPYETLEKSCDVIIEHANRLEKKVHSLIILNKMGYLLDDCEPGDALDMNSVIEKAILSLKVIRPEITFVRNMDEDVNFHGDEEPWRIVVENLLDNALRYAKTWIRIDLHEGELCVTNDGRHMTEDRLNKLFKPYEKGTDGQFGLGLSIIYRVATTYGYKVEAENLTEGVCFKIWKDESRKERRTRLKEKKKESKEQKQAGKNDRV